MTFIYTESPQILPDYACHDSLRPIGRQPENGVYLVYDEQGLALCKAGKKGLVRVDFCSGSAAWRREKGGGEMIAKAVKHTAKPVVWDATGGLGRDAFVLAACGLQVCVFERHPAVYALLADGLLRAQQGGLADIAGRIRLHLGDAAQLLPQLAEQSGRPDVVYLDPMYPERQKSAAVKKEMAYFHELVGMPEGEEALFQAARTVAKKRIVVKRPRLGELLCGMKPDYAYTGKSTRFDVYLPVQADTAKQPE